MIDLTIIERADIPTEWLDTFKQYAAVAEGAQDSLLAFLLTRAVLSVQEYADKSIIACTIRLNEDEAQYGVRLYQTVSEIVSVTDKNGYEPLWSQEGSVIYTKADWVEVVYKTVPNVSAIDELLPIVFQYATALYDMQDRATLANILKQCR